MSKVERRLLKASFRKLQQVQLADAILRRKFIEQDPVGHQNQK